MPVKTKLAKGISLTCIAVSDFVDLLGLELKEYQKDITGWKLGDLMGA